MFYWPVSKGIFKGKLSLISGVFASSFVFGYSYTAQPTFCLWGKPPLSQTPPGTPPGTLHIHTISLNDGADTLEIKEQKSRESPTTCGRNCPGKLPDMAQKVSESVVSIKTEIGTSPTPPTNSSVVLAHDIDIILNTGLFKKEEKIEVSRGSGFLISSQGHIVTNAHVVEDVVDGDGRVTITTSEGSEFKADLFSIDPWSDIAILKVKVEDQQEEVGDRERKWKPVSFADSRNNNLQVGSFVFTFGDPLGLGHSLSFGVVSAIGRHNQDINMSGRMDNRLEYIQVNITGFDYGYSGAPVFNMDGEVVGINVIKADTPGIGFAVCISSIRSLVDQLVLQRRVIRPWFGLKVVSLSQSVIDQISTYARSSNTQKEYHSSLDIDMKCRSEAWNWNWMDWQQGWWLRWWGSVEAGNQPSQHEFEESKQDEHKDDVFPRLLQLLNVSRLQQGVFVLSIFKESPADKAKVKVGDIITHVNNSKVTSTGDFFSAVGYATESVQLTINRLSQDNSEPEKLELYLSPEELDIFLESTHPLNADDGEEYVKYLDKLDEEQREKAEFLK